VTISAFLDDIKNIIIITGVEDIKLISSIFLHGGSRNSEG
jgi:hypothetical protein